MKNRFNFKYSIRPRLVLLFVAQVVLIVSIAGFYVQWQFRNKLEHELGKHLKIVARMISLQIDGDIIVNLLPGDESTRSHQNLIATLQNIKTSTAMKRIFIFDPNYRSLADTKPGMAIGQEYLHLKFDQNELTNVFNGRTASSVLFKGEDGQLYKSGYAPIFRDGTVIAAIRIEGSARTLESIAEIRSNLIKLGLVAMLAAVVLALLFSNRITRPLKQLQQSAREIGRGNYRHKIKVQSTDEVGFLATTMEAMRKNIIQRDKQQQMMLAGVAHEIRNPLGGIELFAGLLSDELPAGEMRDQAAKILTEVKNLKAIIQDFIDYARPAEPQKEICSPKAVFQETTTLLNNELRHIDVTYSEKKPGLTTSFDPMHLKQILLNLVKNSVQAISDHGRIDVVVRNGQNCVEVIISDNGAGIKKEDAHKIFNPFYTSRDTGVGLGLAIVKSLIEANGGHIELVETPEPGTAFRLELPI